MEEGTRFFALLCPHCLHIMKGYGRLKQEKSQAEIAAKQRDFEQQASQARHRQLALMKETEELRK